MLLTSQLFVDVVLVVDVPVVCAICCMQVSRCEKFGYGVMVTQVAATAPGMVALHSSGKKVIHMDQIQNTVLKTAVQINIQTYRPSQSDSQTYRQIGGQTDKQTGRQETHTPINEPSWVRGGSE